MDGGLGFVGVGRLTTGVAARRGLRSVNRRNRCDAGRAQAILGVEEGAMMQLAEAAPVWLPVAKIACGPGLTVFNVAMVVRVFLSWYPNVDVKKVPWVLAVVPTENLLKGTRKVFPPVGGVDISPIIWIFVASFVQEITVGSQGILVLLSNK